MELQRGISLVKNGKLIDSTMKVLVDQIENGEAIGRTERDAPEIDNEVIIRNGEHCRMGSFTDVTVTDAGEYDLFAVSSGINSRDLLQTSKPTNGRRA
jgi:ribosomal protein S12 methylthiotransferase